MEKTRQSIRNALLVAVIGLLPLSIAGQVFVPGDVGIPRDIPIPKGYFPYAVEWSDEAFDTATDVSFLNSAPAGAHGRIIARDGHLYETDTGDRIRFFGTNIMFWFNFPDKEDAMLIAKRLAKAGVNLARIHGFDRERSQNGLLFPEGEEGHDEFDAASLDRLDYLIAQLKAEGIYVWLDMKFCRVLGKGDGLPPEAKDIPFEYQKRVDLFDETMIQDQLKFTTMFLGHLNPHTGMTYAEDPCVAVVECVNEDCLLTYWEEALGLGLDTLPPYFKNELRGLWNNWLKRKYGTDMALSAAWYPPDRVAIPMIRSKSWAATMPDSSWLDVRQTPSSVKGGVKNVQLNVKKTNEKEPWNVKIGLSGIRLQAGKRYSLTFKAKAEKPRPLSLYVFKDAQDFHAMGLDQTVTVAEEWQEYNLSFTAKDVGAGETAYLAFNLGAEKGNLWLSEVDLVEGEVGGALKEGESLELGTIPIYGSNRQKPDWLDFLVDTERVWADRMIAHIRDDIGCEALIVTSQANFAGTTAYHRDANSDLVDTHTSCFFGGWDGPEWTRDSWYIENKSQVDKWTDRFLGEMGRMAMYKVAGKPFSISEYDICWPNDQCAETMPLFSSFAALQDWDILLSVYIYSYGHREAPNMIQDFYDHGNNPAKWSFYPQAALLFRQALIAPAQKTIRLEFAPKPWQRFEAANRAWEKLAPPGPIGFFGRRLESSISDPPIGSDRVKQDGMDAQPSIVVRQAPKGKVFLAESDTVVMCSGFIGGTTFKTENMDISSPSFTGNFASLALASLDGLPIESSARLLLTIAGRVENQDLKWNRDRTRIGSYWGFGPPIAQRIPATLSVNRVRPGKVWALNSKGERVGEVKVEYRNGRLKFAPMQEADSLVFEIE